MTPLDHPSRAVLRSFGLPVEELRALPGGQGAAFRAGQAVLKPAPSAAEADWSGCVLSGVREDGFRISRPMCSADGLYAVHGWTAWSLVEGTHEFDQWERVLAAGAALHRALSGVPRPAFLDERHHPWAVADRMAWGEVKPRMNCVDLQVCAIRLAQHCVRTEQESQVVHGDLTGNVLLMDSAPPAIIDFTPYWRPANYALAIVVVDAIDWHHAADDLIGLLPAPERLSNVARAALFRLFTADQLVGGARRGDPAYLQAHVERADHICDLLDE